MRYAIVSDVHANLQAWLAVRRDIAGMRADRVICLGDTVGYGPSPAEVLGELRKHVAHFLLGNHDAALCGKMDEDLFNDEAREIIRWTRGRLAPAVRRRFAAWPLTLRGKGFRCAHSDFAEPGRFPYIVEPEDAMPSWRAVTEPLLFVGHTHEPALFLLGASGKPHRVEAQDFEMEDGKRYIVNVGSVGQPRDGRADASYGLYDSERRAVFFRRVAYDVGAYRRAAAAADLPAISSAFLAHVPVGEAPAAEAAISMAFLNEAAPVAPRPPRPRAAFRPPDTADKHVRDAVLVSEITELRGRLRRWQVLAMLLGLLLAGAGLAWVRHATRAREIAPASLPAVRAEARETGVNLLVAPERPSAAGRAVSGWTLRLGDRRRQSIRVEADPDHGHVFLLRSSSPNEELILRSGPVEVRPGQRLTVEGQFRPGAGYGGFVALEVEVRRAATAGQAASVVRLVSKEPNQRRRSGWLAAQETFDLPAGAADVQVQVTGRFRGDLRVGGLSLARRP